MPPRLNPEVRGWLRHLWRKAMTPDDWSRNGEPHPWWDKYSLAPMLSFPRFDLSESSYAFLPLVRKTPAWREVYSQWAGVPDGPHYEELYRSAVGAIGWNNRFLPVINPSPEPRLMTLALLMAREFGDTTTARRVGRKLAKWQNSRFFNASGGAEQGDDEFGHFFHYKEPYPRGQESALYMLKDLLDGEGDWWRCFNEPDREKFAAPTVTGVDYPAMGLSVAWNDKQAASLKLETYAATQGARGSATRFSVEQIPNIGLVRVLRDGSQFGAWRATGDAMIEIETEIGDHSYEIHTGYRGHAATSVQAPATAHEQTSTRPINVRTGVREMVGAVSAIRAGVVGCPCCAATA